MGVEVNAISNAGEISIAFRQDGTRSFERDLQEQAVDDGKAQVLEIEIRGSGGVFVAGERGERFFCFAGNERIDADDRVLCGELLIRHLDLTIFVKHNLKAIHGLSPVKS